MPAWAWALAVLLSLAALSALLLSLLYVRYRVAWNGTWGGLSSEQGGSVRIEFGFPGFMRALDWDSAGAQPAPETSPHTATATPESTPRAAGTTHASSPEPARNPSTRGATAHREEAAPAAGPTVTVPKQHAVREDSPRPKDPNRYRKALFRLATDGPAWGLLVRYGFRVLKRFHKLLGPRVELAVGHPDPALLGRLAGRWYAVAPLLPLGDTAVGFRFQDRAPTLRVRVSGGFSALSLLRFGAGILLTFPFFGLGLRAWHGWRRREMTGWRAWTYRRIQSL